MAIFQKHWSEAQHRQWSRTRSKGQWPYIIGSHVMTAMLPAFAPMIGFAAFPDYWALHTAVLVIAVGLGFGIALLLGLSTGFWRWRLHEEFFHKQVARIAAVTS